MSTWLITGGAGFIGSNFLRHLVAASSARLVILDALTYAGTLATIADLIDGARVRFVHADIRDAAAVRDVFDRYDIECVAHLAAESHVDRSIVGPRAFIETNVTGTLNLLSAAHKCWQGASGRRCFLHVCTDEVFGELTPQDAPRDETSSYAPSYAIDCSRAQRELDWAPRHRLESSLGEVVRWYLAQREWIDAIRSGEYLRFYEQQYRHRLQAPS